MNNKCVKWDISKMYLVVPKHLSEIFILTDKDNSLGILVSGRLVSVLSNYSVGILIEHFTTKQPRVIADYVYPEYLEGLENWIREIVDDEILAVSEISPKRSERICNYIANTPLPFKYEGKSVKFLVEGCLETIVLNDKKVYILTLNDSFKKYADFIDMNKFASVSNYGNFGTTLYPTQKASFVGANCSPCGDCQACSGCAVCILCEDVNFAAGLASFSSLLRTISISRSTSAFLSGRDTRL